MYGNGKTDGEIINIGNELEIRQIECGIYRDYGKKSRFTNKWRGSLIIVNVNGLLDHPFSYLNDIELCPMLLLDNLDEHVIKVEVLHGCRLNWDCNDDSIQGLRFYTNFNRKFACIGVHEDWIIQKKKKKIRMCLFF